MNLKLLNSLPVLAIASLSSFFCAAASADEIADVRAVFAEVNSADLTTESFEYNDPPTGSSGEVIQSIEPGTSSFRKIKVTVGVDDGGSTVTEFYFDSEGALRFVFLTREQYEYGDGGDPFLEASQLRLYFDSNQHLLRALTKSARAESPEKLSSALDKSENKEVTVSPIPARRIVECVDELCRSLNAERARDASQLNMAALALFDESEPPANKQEWVSVPLEAGKTYSSKKFHHEIFNEIIARAKLPHPKAEAPAVHLFHTHRYPGDFSVSMLATTDRLFHDSIDSIRYRMDIRESAEDKIHVSFFGYQIRPRIEESRKGAAEGWVAKKITGTSSSPE